MTLGVSRDPWRAYRLGVGFKVSLIIAIFVLLLAGAVAMSVALELFDAV